MRNLLITGAASGIGRAVAQRFHQAGWQPGLLDVDEAGLADLALELGGDVWYQVVDVTDESAMKSAAGDFAARFSGQLRLLFNSAGVLQMGHFESVPLTMHRRTFDINVIGLINACQAAYPWLRQTPDARVINMSSASALYGIPHLASYSASKFAVRGLTEALNIEWAQQGIHVCDLMPPFVNTGMVTGQRFRAPAVDRLGVKLTAEDVAEVAWRAAAGNAVHYPVGLPFYLAVQLEKLFPRSVTRALIRLMSRES